IACVTIRHTRYKPTDIYTTSMSAATPRVPVAASTRPRLRPARRKTGITPAATSGRATGARTAADGMIAASVATPRSAADSRHRTVGAKETTTPRRCKEARRRYAWLAVLILQAVDSLPDGLGALVEVLDDLGRRLLLKVRVVEPGFDLRQIGFQLLPLFLPARVARSRGKVDAPGGDGEWRPSIEVVDEVCVGKLRGKTRDGAIDGAVELQLPPARRRARSLPVAARLLDDPHHACELGLRPRTDESIAQPRP